MINGRIAKSVTATITALALATTISAPQAMASGSRDPKSEISSQDLSGLASSSEQVEGTSAARDVISQNLGSTSVDPLVEDTVDLGDSSDADIDSTNKSTSVDDNFLKSVPIVDEDSGSLVMPDPESGERAEISVSGSKGVSNRDGVVEASSSSGIKSFGHITERMSGQMVGLLGENDKSRSIDFNVSLPKGYSMKYGTDGSIDILNRAGESKGTIAKPWAVDSSGQKLSSHFEITRSGVRQVLDSKTETRGVVAMDPNFWWWAATAGKCAVEIAPLFATGGAAVAARAPRLVAKVVELTNKSAKLKAAVAKVGGARNASVALVKRGAQELKNKLPEGIRNKLPDGAPTDKEKAFAAVAWPFIADNIWDLVGLGSCSSIIKGG